MDDQIKHLGYRIELGEIESALNAIPGVEAAVCLFDDSRDRIICVFQGQVQQNDIVRCLKERLPRYMLPNEYHPIPSIPLTRGGKIDRTALKEAFLCRNK